MIRKKIIHGQIGNNLITEVVTRIISYREFLSLQYKPLVFHNGKILMHISGCDFCIAGLSYGDENWHYIKINAGTIEICVDSVFVNKNLSRMISSTKPLGEKSTYLMYCSDTGLHKIGKSDRVEKRLIKLRSIYPSIKLIHLIPFDIENKLHLKYDHLRVFGEWFNLSPADVIAIKEVKYKEEV